MNKPVKVRPSVNEYYETGKVSLQKIIDSVPSGIDRNLIKIEPLEYELRISYPIYEDNPNYEDEMIRYDCWRFQRINELERELRALKPEPGRLSDDND